MEDIHTRIQKRRLELGLSLQELAEQVGVSWQSVYNWELPEEKKGRAPARQRIAQVAAVLKTSTEWLTAGIDVNVPIRGKYAFIPLIDLTNQGGGDVKYHDEVGDLDDANNTYAYRRDYLEQLGVKPAACRVFLAPDDSMALGEQLLVDLAQRQVIDAKVYLLGTPVGAIVRRLYVQLDGTVRVRADRPDIPEQVLPLAALRVLGRVVAFQGAL